MLHVSNGARQAVDKVLNPKVVARERFKFQLQPLFIRQRHTGSGGAAIFSTNTIMDSCLEDKTL
jgi:hypothetical protein